MDCHKLKISMDYIVRYMPLDLQCETLSQKERKKEKDRGVCEMSAQYNSVDSRR